MNKWIRNSLILFVMVFVATQVSYAQMINYNRRNKSQKIQSTPAAKPAAKAPSKQVARPSDLSQQIQKGLETAGDPKVTNRVERLYDINRDGVLQKKEVKDFYKDVVSSVQNKGKFRVSSDLLKTFDTNSDGKITRYEIKGMINEIN